MSDSHFSENYEEARGRFRDAATTAGATLQSYPVNVDSHPSLSIDVALVGSESGPTVLLSSGLHGVEGFFGSALQLAFLEQLAQANPHPNIRYVLVHALNPFGFSKIRRFDENNVDPNRNFRLPGAFEGAPSEYALLNQFLNPESPPSRLEAFRLKTILQIIRRGSGTIKNAVAGGQYEYPKGLFFGGSGPSQSYRLVQEHCDSWLASSQTILHLDFHSGLGRFGDYKMLVTDRSNSNHEWFAETFGAERIQRMDPAGIAYKASGLFGDWMREHLSTRDYRYACPEFGTYGGIRVLRALRAENRAHHHCAAGDPRLDRAKKELLECFCPNSSSWRIQVIGLGLLMIARGASSLSAIGERERTD